jgi:hypothetical protein
MSPESPEKYRARLYGQNRSMFPRMETTLTDAGGGVHLALTLALLVASSVNLLLACVWL